MDPPRQRFRLQIGPGTEDEWLAWLAEAGFADAFCQRDYPHGLLADEPDVSPRSADLIVTVPSARVGDLAARIDVGSVQPWLGGRPALQRLPDPTTAEADPESLWRGQWRPFRCAGFAIRAEFVSVAEIPRRPGDLPLILVPGSAFGSGGHPTTRMALRAVRRIWDQAQPPRWLDVGTGSGILAVAAARLGAAQVLALDPEAGSPQQALRMAGLNGVASRVQAWRGGFDTVASTFPAVVANLFADLLQEGARDLAALVQPGGLIYTGGIVDRRWELTQDSLHRAGLVPEPWHGPWPDARGRWRGAVWRRTCPAE